jgi:hypothetical protein
MTVYPDTVDWRSRAGTVRRLTTTQRQGTESVGSIPTPQSPLAVVGNSWNPREVARSEDSHRTDTALDVSCRSEPPR